MMGDDWDWGWWMVFAIPMMAAFWFGLIWAVVAMLRQPADRGQDRGTLAGPTALEILERRYARGEVSDEEFDAKRRTLTDARSGSA
jgi:putative membrane protein